MPEGSGEYRPPQPAMSRDGGGLGQRLRGLLPGEKKAREARERQAAFEKWQQEQAVLKQQKEQEEKARLEEQERQKQILLQQITWPSALPEWAFKEKERKEDDPGSRDTLAGTVSKALLLQAMKAGIPNEYPPFPWRDTAYESPTKRGIHDMFTKQRPSPELVALMCEQLGLPSFDPNPEKPDSYTERTAAWAENRRVVAGLQDGTIQTKDVVHDYLEQEIEHCALEQPSFFHLQARDSFNERDVPRLQNRVDELSYYWGMVNIHTQLYKQLDNPSVEQPVKEALITAYNAPHAEDYLR